MLLYQFPGVAEEWLSANQWTNFRTLFRHPDEDDTIADLEANPSLTPGLNYFRAIVNPESFNRPSTGQFLLAIDNPPCPRYGHQRWASGAAATSLTEAQMTRSREHVAGLCRYTRLEGPGHWMQLEAPDRVNALLLDFLTLD